MDKVKVIRDWLRDAELVRPGEIVRRLRGQSIEILLVELDSKKPSNPHSHGEEQLVVILQGNVCVTVDESKWELDEGSALVIPPHLTHDIRALDSNGATVLEVRRTPVI